VVDTDFIQHQAADVVVDLEPILLPAHLSGRPEDEPIRIRLEQWIDAETRDASPTYVVLEGVGGHDESADITKLTPDEAGALIVALQTQLVRLRNSSLSR